VVTVKNGVDTRFFQPGDRDNDVRRLHGFGDRFLVLYIGAHGISHALSAVLDAAGRLRDDPNVLFAFVGEGAEKTMLRQRAESLRLDNVVFLPGQPRERMPAWYAAADVVLVPLRDVALFDAFIPSKMFEIMAAARPIVGSVRGEARRILEQSQGAIVVDPEDAGGIADSVRRLEADPELRARLGANGRRFAVARYDRSDLARLYLDSLLDVCGLQERKTAPSGDPQHQEVAPPS
jgi:colanic acid biosynthesis glycosyl transferase WcaI